MKTRNILWIFLIVIVVLLAIYYVFQKTEEPGIIKIGAMLPLTGESAYWGANIKNGINLALDEINSNGGVLGKEIKVVYEDTRGNATTGTQVVNKLITIDKVQCIIGDVISSVILAVAPILEKNEVPIIGFGESAEISNAGDYIFRNWNSAASDAEITGNFAAQNSKKIAVLYQNDAFGISAKKLFIEQLQNSGANVIFEESFMKAQSDFRTLIDKLRSIEYDGIYIASFHIDALNFLKQYKELNLRKTKIYGVSSWEENSFIEFAKKNFSNLIYYGYPAPPDPNNIVVMNFVKNYENKYGKVPEILCDNGYDALYMFKYAIDKAGEYNGKLIKDALYTLKDFQGASGVMSFDKNGDVHKPFGLKTISAEGIKWVIK